MIAPKSGTRVTVKGQGPNPSAFTLEIAAALAQQSSKDLQLPLKLIFSSLGLRDLGFRSFRVYLSSPITSNPTSLTDLRLGFRD